MEYTFGLAPWEHTDEQLITLCEHCHHIVERLKEFEYARGIREDEIKGYKVKQSEGAVTLFFAVGNVIVISLFNKENKPMGGTSVFSRHSEGLISVIRAAANHKK
jgi:hypothetical protein